MEGDYNAVNSLVVKPQHSEGTFTINFNNPTLFRPIYQRDIQIPGHKNTIV
jgi:hypothetical protein